MRLYIEGPVNKYYVQTLCMIFFPGAKFFGRGGAERGNARTVGLPATGRRPGRGERRAAGGRDRPGKVVLPGGAGGGGAQLPVS